MHAYTRRSLTDEEEVDEEQQYESDQCIYPTGKLTGLWRDRLDVFWLGNLRPGCWPTELITVAFGSHALASEYTTAAFFEPALLVVDCTTPQTDGDGLPCLNPPTACRTALGNVL